MEGSFMSFASFLALEMRGLARAKRAQTPRHAPSLRPSTGATNSTTARLYRRRRYGVDNYYIIDFRWNWGIIH
ncbi:hypothetical protein ANCCAN_25584 [Ancylostoma caninum]|uniref:Uncharacterized protein n=1 Tax=Ancylostoma caninum TaxID=29170 RepID=A0A368FER8_ANCCA|nr:hypothetical protein ANCCAN_25584 [Ancylostoma caninum]